MMATIEHRVNLLRNFPLFQEARQDELERLAHLVTPLYVERNRILFQHGDPCEGFHIVVYDRVSLSVVSARGIEKPLQLVETGGCCGDITMFLERDYYLTARSMDDCML